MLSSFDRKHFIVYGVCTDKLKTYGLSPSALNEEKTFLTFAKDLFWSQSYLKFIFYRSYSEALKTAFPVMLMMPFLFFTGINGKESE